MRRPPWLTTLIIAVAAFVIVRVIFYYTEAPWDVIISLGFALAVLVTSWLWRRRTQHRAETSDRAEPRAFAEHHR